jgi:predicted RNA binding protein YcfA (HicA-like mRNA interferase family)
MKLPLRSGRQVHAALKRLGFGEIDRRGSHVKMEHPDGRRIVFLVFPNNPNRPFHVCRRGGGTGKNVVATAS